MKIYASREEQIIAEAQYFVNSKSTIRKTAQYFKMSKSNVFTDITKRLQDLDKVLAEDVRSVLNKNKSERHIRGGMATKRKHSQVSK